MLNNVRFVFRTVIPGCLLIALIQVFAIAAPPSASPAGTSAPQPVADLQTIQAWVRELDSDNFLSRESATENLLETGLAAIGPIIDALSSSSLEVTTRSMHVLRELALSDDVQTSAAASDALVRISSVQRASVARRAASTLSILPEIRQQRAIAHLEELGAKFPRQAFVGFVTENRKLEIGEQWEGKSKDLTRLQWLGNVTEVELSGEKVSDEFIRYVGQMPSLRKVVIYRAKITDQAMAELRSLQDLRELQIMYCQVSDQAVPHLSVHMNVARINLYGTAMTDQGAKALEQQLQKKKGTDEKIVDYRRGAFLGVGGDPATEGCEINLVQPESAAAQAGLEVRDIIVRYNGEEVSDFDQLTDLIRRQDPGATAKLEILRGTKVVTKEVTLGHWSPIR